MLVLWYYIDGRLASLKGTEAQCAHTLKELKANGVTIKPARPPKRIGPAEYASASAMVRKG